MQLCVSVPPREPRRDAAMGLFASIALGHYTYYPGDIAMQKLRRIRFLVIGIFLSSLATMTPLWAQIKPLERREYSIFIILDTVDTWSTDIRDGIKAGLAPALRSAGASASYTEFDTQLDPAKAAAIVEAIKARSPDLIFVASFPDGFADNHITAKLKDARYRFVSENAVPSQIGLIDSWQKPGGNVTGVGVFVQLASQLRIARTINPGLSKLVFYSWDAMSSLNDWFEEEIKAAAVQEGVELVAFHRVKNLEEHFRLFMEYDRRGPGFIAMIGISPFIHSDGKPADANRLEPAFIKENIRNTFFLSYDESAIRQAGGVAGASVIWSDIGAQMAEKGVLILRGAKPGDIPWSFPRKYNLLINLLAARNIGAVIPPNLLGAAYRVYTDDEGNFSGPGIRR